jgi:hypothetical protein
VFFETAGLIVCSILLNSAGSSGDGADDYVLVDTSREKGCPLKEGKGTDKGTWHGMVDLILHYRFCCCICKARADIV